MALAEHDLARVTDITTAEQKVIDRAMKILSRKMSPGASFTSARVAGEYFVMKSHALEREVFSAAWLDSQHRVICVEELSQGSITQASVYPREIVKAALARNAAAVIFHHNHPSGSVEPSLADEALTRTLSDALRLVDVKVLDHIVTGGASWVSFAEKGLI